MTDAMETFRTDVRAWLEENCPASMQGEQTLTDGEAVWGGRRAKYKNPDSKVWLDKMAERGWTAPTWPKDYGGGGLSKEENLVLQSELRRD